VKDLMMCERCGRFMEFNRVGEIRRRYNFKLRSWVRNVLYRCTRCQGGRYITEKIDNGSVPR